MKKDRSGLNVPTLASKSAAANRVFYFLIYQMYLQRRNRILRATPSIRAMVAETIVTPAGFIAPLFIDEAENVHTEIASMPGYFRNSIDNTVKEVKELWSLGIKSVLLFIKCKDELKDNTGKEAWNKDGLMQRSIRAIKEAVPEMYVMTDVALDPYSSYGHDGIVEDGEIVNDPTVEALVKMSISHAEAGVDMVAPSDMMDGRIGAIRNGLEGSGYTKVGIMAYSAKYASCFYGPFRDALDSAPGFGDKKTYQMDPANRIEAVKEALMDVEEGADIVMVKPGLPYLDIVREVKNAVDVPVSVYNISGEYAMIKAAAKMGWINEEKAILETLTSFKRAGADLIATYFAKDAARLLNR
jgi:porphobilinogen synthase